MHKKLLTIFIGIGMTLLTNLPAKSQEQSASASSSQEAIPAEFQFDRTLISPGQLAFIALPFEKQVKGGICVAASVYNVLKYQNPTFPLNQRELFRVFNNETSGKIQPWPPRSSANSQSPKTTSPEPEPWSPREWPKPPATQGWPPQSKSRQIMPASSIRHCGLLETSNSGQAMTERS